MPGSSEAPLAVGPWGRAPPHRRHSHSHAPSSASSSASSSGSLLRHYIDPWDLENYAYLRRRDGGCPSTPALESSQSDFSYVHGSLEAAAALACANGGGPVAFACPPPEVNEEPFYNAFYKAPPATMRRRRSVACPSPAGIGQTGSGSWRGDGADGCRLYSPSLLVRRPPGDLVYVYGGRKLALPDAPAAAPHRCCYSLSGGSSGEEDEERCCYFDASTDSPPPPPLALPPPPPPPPRYALSRGGHLRLDYSCSWASLDRYIATAE